MRGVGNGASLRLSACGYCVHTSRSRWWRARAADTGVFPPPLRVGESHLSRALLRWQKKLILKKAFLIRESLDGNADLDFPRSSRPA